MSLPEVKGLFLSGGQSQRMGMDKGLLCYAGAMTEVERWKQIFEALQLPFYWSQRPDQYPVGLFPHITRLIDASPGAGPLGALVTAHRQFPDAAWLVLACDWPLLGVEDMRWLLSQRRAGHSATSYRNRGRREPLCSLYEPEFLRAAVQAWDAGERSLNRLLQASDAWEVTVLDEKRFLNANDPEARRLVMSAGLA